MNTTEPRINPAQVVRASSLSTAHIGGRLYAINGLRLSSAAGHAIEGVDRDYRMDGERFVFVTIWVGTKSHPDQMVGVVLSPDTKVRVASADDLRAAITHRNGERLASKKLRRRV